MGNNIIFQKCTLSSDTSCKYIITHLFSDQIEDLTPEKYASAFSQMTFSWVDPLMKVGWKKQLFPSGIVMNLGWVEFRSSMGRIWVEFRSSSGWVRVEFGLSSGRVRVEFGLSLGRVRVEFGSSLGRVLVELWSSYQGIIT